MTLLATRHLLTGKWKRTGRPDVLADGFILRSSKPDASNTGARLASYQTYAGDYTANVAGAEVTGLRIQGKLRVTAPNVWVHDNLVEGPATAPGQGVSTLLVETTTAATGALVEFNTVYARAVSESTDGIRLGAGTARRNHVYNVVDPFGVVGPGCTFEGNYAHDMAYITPCSYQADNQTHNDVLQFHTPTATGCQVIGNAFVAKYGSGGTNAPDGTWSHRGGTTPAGAPYPDASVIMFGSSIGSNVTLSAVVEDNWFEGGYQPVNGGGPVGLNIGRVWRNRFDGDSTGGPGYTSASHTIDVSSDTTVDTGDGTANQNVYYNAAPVNVRRNQ